MEFTKTWKWQQAGDIVEKKVYCGYNEPVECICQPMLRCSPPCRRNPSTPRLKVTVISERRKNKRNPHKTNISLESLDPGTSMVATMFNYSRGGLYFESDTFISPGTEIFIGISGSPYSSESTTYECHRVKVKWLKELYDSPYRYGYGVEHNDPVECSAASVIVAESDEDDHQKEEEESEMELRKHPRKSFTKPVYFSTDNRYYQGLIKDISRGGLFIQTDESFSLGNEIHLVIPNTKYDKNVMIKGKVVRMSQAGVGVKFTGLVKKEKSEG